MAIYRYTAQQYASRQGAPPLLLFVASAGEIRQWAGVPRKAFDYLHGFQRSLDEARVREVGEFYREDPRNISPTAVVVGFGSPVSVKPVSTIESENGFCDAELTIDVPDYANEPLEALARLVLTRLEERLSPEVVETIREDVDDAVAEAQRLEDQEVVDQAAEADVADSETIMESDRSYLADFYAELLGQVQGSVPWPEDVNALREVLYSLLKPGIIVDGQHRVFGAAHYDETMRLAVCAMPQSDWAENVYQFVVINQKAKPIKPAFLSAIIATSLTQAELKSVYNRLNVSRVNVNRSEIMEHMNSDKTSPFKEMIDFEVPGSPGFLSFPGMWRLADDFRRIDSTYPLLVENGGWPRGDRTWIPFFYAFWSGIRDAFLEQDPRLWSEPSAANPNKLLMIVTMQEVQRVTLELWADARMLRLSSAENVRTGANEFWRDFPSEFFTDDWKQKGLQTQIGRALLRDALVVTRRKHGQRSWSHRRLGLFTGTRVRE